MLAFVEKRSLQWLNSNTNRRKIDVTAMGYWLKKYFNQIQRCYFLFYFQPIAWNFNKLRATGMPENLDY